MKKLLIFDLETTGLSFENDRIIQCAIVVKHLDGTIDNFNHYFNPGIPINPEATAVHKITDDMLVDMPQFEEYAVKIHAMFMDTDTIIAGFNIMGFDFKMLQAEFGRCGLGFSLVGRNVLELGNLVKILFPRTLEAMFKQEVGYPIQEMFGAAHDAMNDTKASLYLFETMVSKLQENKYDLSMLKDELPQLEGMEVINAAEALGSVSRFGNEILDIDGKFRIKDGKTVWGFGKYINQEVDGENFDQRGLLQWMIGKDFKSDTIELVKKFLE